MSKKFIGITQRLINNDTYHEVREALALDWGKLFASKNMLDNYLPLPLSYEIDFKKYIDVINGVIISGGNDIYAVNKNTLSKIRDDYELKIIDYCINKKIPLLGVCRGAQLLAHYFKLEIKQCKNHIGNHKIIKNKKNIMVNSFHNYCIFNTNDEILPLHIANDNSIESFKHVNLPIYGVMWHIERKFGDLSILKEWISNIN